ncbi:hypothetical protein CC86DRAFT_96503 [Ophiobolus disseminans]|uniref:Uncharacterized protein n=1 Tax=Ophiobolus disseminans TaxID=1469910 RepID=A0A6A6ZNB9_9PLEO|nr:hypothetical protein CC86DRAFT_96503 [Ophiobolus disseminans]
MLTREGFVVADMSGQSNLQRSSWKAEAIRRGNLKISGPIPITEDTPLNDEEEKEFAETGLLSPSQPQDELDAQDPRPQTPPQPENSPPNIPLEPASLTSHPVEESVQEREVLHERQPSKSPPRPRQVSEMARESVIEPPPQTPQTPFRSTPESGIKGAQKKKRKSGLRGVFRKMFGRKSKDEQEEDEPARRGHSYHHSDPGMLTRQSPPRELRTPTGPRISDLPVEELRPLHPLGQHLPFPMNVNAPQASPPHEYLTFDMQKPDLGRRRATLPSVPSASIHRHSLDEPRGRLSTWDERLDEDPIPSPGIGIALSSPTQAFTPRGSKRRSRSADALRELVKDRASLDRRRSAEIRYWRQSYTSGSMYSRPQTARTVETIRSVQMQEPAITEPIDEVLEMSATLVQADEPSPLPTPVEQAKEREFQAPVSAFNFGLKSGFSDTDTVPSEHPVPLSPPEKSRNRMSIEERVAHLEGTFQSLESSMHRMSSRTNRQTIILSDAPRNLRSRNRNSSSQSGSTSSHSRLPEYQSSNDTLKSSPASPTLVRPGAEGDSKEKVIEKLYEALKYERTARKALEQQVLNLRHDIADLHALVNKLIASATATSPSYPTPSPDALILSTEDRLLTPRLNEFGTTRNVVGRKDSERSERRRYNEEWNSSPDDLATPNDGDVWATPKEEGFGAGGSGFFQEGRERGYA